MKKVYFFLLLLMWVLKASAQTGIIEGNVMYRIDSLNIEEAKIAVIGKNKQFETTTDYNGNFRINSLHPEVYYIVVQSYPYLNHVTRNVVVKNDSITKLKIELNRRQNTSRKCPVDHKTDEVIPIVYGLIRTEVNLMKIEKGEAIRGGCGMTGNDPMWHCKKHSRSF